ncbi:hypothetical protein N8K70_06690 [Microbacterium betulae]|uniref:DUF4064 domain-containing protein n=1 Tax=Microbacterium betulae TaxID=2981139 RepID=A0AA97FK86_9MICO|nr:hypothetical protein [Microbacterium sp. AB]WOF24349.1 hypothetical protein N8K70_06690 [Microbacterium sp. AB]
MSADQNPPSYPPAPGAYPAPPAAPYPQPQDPRFAATIDPRAPRPPRSSQALGRVALVLALAALVGGASVLTVVGLPIGAQLAHAQLTGSPEFDLSQLSPVRDAVLTGEITAWVASAFGVWALVQGIVAIARRRGRGAGIAAVVVAAAAPVIVAAGFLLGFLLGVGIGLGGA